VYIKLENDSSVVCLFNDNKPKVFALAMELEWTLLVFYSAVLSLWFVRSKGRVKFSRNPSSSETGIDFKIPDKPENR